MKFLAFLILIAISNFSYSQSFGDSSYLKSPVFHSVEKAPKFPDGMKGFYKFIGENLKFPADSFAITSNKMVTAAILINKEGRVVYGKIEKGLNDAYNNSVLELLKSMPDWQPGIQNGRPVPVWVTIPILL